MAAPRESDLKTCSSRAKVSSSILFLFSAILETLPVISK